MTDIVQQLHDLYRSHPVVMEAADEIERLREALMAVPVNDRECQCPKCGRLHKPLGAGVPPPSITSGRS